METRRIKWDEEKEFTAEKVRYTVLKKYNNLPTSGRRYNKYPKDDHILTLFGLVQKLVYNSKKSSDKSTTSNRESTKREISYTKDLPPWMME